MKYGGFVPQGWRMDLRGISPDQHWPTMLRVAKEHPMALDVPEPRAQMLRFGESSLDFRLRAWASMDDWVTMASDMHVTINSELQKAGITIPFPQRDLHIKTGSITGDTDMPSADEIADATGRVDD